MRSKLTSLSFVFCVVALCGFASGCTSLPENGGGSAADVDSSGDMGSVGGETSAGEGTLRMLITDKPFPFEFVDQAWVTITKVEVRRVGDAPDEGCEVDTDCDDGLFCNGVELCDSNGLCLAGISPCPAETNCFEDIDTCGLCTNGLQCDDDLFCTGVEVCDSNGLCQPGAAPCPVDELCIEDLGTCGECVDSDCDDEDDCLEDASTCGIDDDGDGDGRPFVCIFEGSKQFDLVQLQGGETDLLAEADLPSGRYTQARIHVTEGRVVLTDGREFVLSVPSGAQSGIKLRFDVTLEADGESTLLIDVDLSRAFKPIPGSGADRVEKIRSFKFQPSLAMRIATLDEVGAISGTVTDELGDPLADVTVTALLAGEEVTTTATDAEGAYLLPALQPGVYSVSFVADGFEDAQVADVVVSAGVTTEHVDASLHAVSP